MKHKSWDQVHSRKVSHHLSLPLGAALMLLAKSPLVVEAFTLKF